MPTRSPRHKWKERIFRCRRCKHKMVRYSCADDGSDVCYDCQDRDKRTKAEDVSHAD